MAFPGSSRIWSRWLFEGVRKLDAIHPFTGDQTVYLCIFCQAPMMGHSQVHSFVMGAAHRFLELPDGKRVYLPLDNRLAICTDCAGVIKASIPQPSFVIFPWLRPCSHCSTLILIAGDDVQDNRMVERTIYTRRASGLYDVFRYDSVFLCLRCQRRMTKAARVWPYTTPMMLSGLSRGFGNALYCRFTFQKPPQAFSVMYDPPSLEAAGASVRQV